MTHTSYRHLSRAERDEIAILLTKGYGMREIAQVMRGRKKGPREVGIPRFK